MKEELSVDYLLKRNIILIIGEINEEMASRVISQILYLDENNAKEIIFYINSPGGSVTQGLAIYDTMKYVEPIISTIAVGQCYSMGAFLLSCGDAGHRYALPNSEVMIHQPIGGVNGQATEVINAAEHIKKTREKLNDILAKNCNRSIADIERDTERDYFMSAKEAKEYGIIDHIITNKKESGDQDDQ